MTDGEYTIKVNNPPKTAAGCYLRLARILTLLLSLATTASTLAELRVSDDVGNTVSLQGPARRIISLAPHITELLYAAGAGDAIVGTVAYSDYPEAAKALPRVGAYNALDLEAILSLKPDLVVAWDSGSPRGSVQKLQTLDIPVFFSEPKTLEDIARNLRQLGRLAGTESSAKSASQSYLAGLRRLRAQYGGKKTVTVFYQVWHQPLMTINGKHLISQVIALCGGRNVFAGLDALAPKVSVESVLAANPQVIVGGGVATANPRWQQTWQRWPQLEAVKNAHLFYVDPDLLQRHTPRILQGAEILCRQLEGVRNEP